MRYSGLSAGFSTARTVYLQPTGMTLNCWVTPWWTIKISPRKSQEESETRNGFNKRLKTSWELESECFHFLRLRTGSIIGLRGLSEEVVKLRGFLLRLAVKSQPRAVTLGASPPWGPLRYSCLMSQSRSPAFPENRRFWGDRVTESKGPHSLVLWEGFTAP